MEENSLGSRGVHHVHGHLVGRQIADALLPDLVRLAHGHPDVCVDHVRALHRAVHILGQCHGAAAESSERFTLRHQLRRGEILLRRAGHKVHSHLGTGDHQGVAHVVAGVAHIDQLHAL